MLPAAVLLLLLAGPCADLTWDPSEPGAVYELALNGEVLGETTALTWPAGCASGLFQISARDAAGNVGEWSHYWERGPCALGCPQECTELGPLGRCLSGWDLAVGSPCCRTLAGLP